MCHYKFIVLDGVCKNNMPCPRKEKNTMAQLGIKSRPFGRLLPNGLGSKYSV